MSQSWPHLPTRAQVLSSGIHHSVTKELVEATEEQCGQRLVGKWSLQFYNLRHWVLPIVGTRWRENPSPGSPENSAQLVSQLQFLLRAEAQPCHAADSVRNAAEIQPCTHVALN